MSHLALLLVLILQSFGEIKGNECSDKKEVQASCGLWKPYCKESSIYIHYMKSNCKKTCGFCPVNGGYSAWGSYGACSVSCGGGVKERTRSCSNPAPKNGGKACSGPSKETASCNTNSCPGALKDGCSDNSGNCPIWKSFCSKGSEFYTYMKSNCRETCGFCKAPCRDDPKQKANCPSFATYCKKSSKYYQWMQDHCKETCGFCKEESKTCGKRGLTTSRVIGGVEAAPNTWPWSVALLKFGSYFCGGSLIDNQWVLTAAHCLHNREHQATYMEAVLGEHDRTLSEGHEKTIEIGKIINHPDYNPATLDNDIALIKLKTSVSIKFTAFGTPDKIGLICLPEAGVQASLKQRCFITGWGKKKHPGPSSTVLMEAEMPIVTNEACMKQNTAWGGTKITSRMLCAGNAPGSAQSGCHGDSGGPYVCTEDGKSWTLQGVVSWGSSSCNRADKYTVFARVSEFINWIEKTKKDN